MKKYTLLVIFFLIGLSLKAQLFEVYGLINTENNAPIELVNVYVSGTTIGTSTNARGQFRLTGIKAGEYDLIISHVNYELIYLPLKVSDQSIDLGTIKLKELAYDLTTVEVNQKEDKKWNRHLRQFKIFSRVI